METQRFQLNILQQFLSEVHHSSARTLMGTHRSPRSSWLTRPVGLEGVTEVAHQTLTMGGSGDQTPADEFTEYWAPDIIMNDYKYIKLYTYVLIYFICLYFIYTEWTDMTQRRYVLLQAHGLPSSPSRQSILIDEGKFLTLPPSFAWAWKAWNFLPGKTQVFGPINLTSKKNKKIKVFPTSTVPLWKSSPCSSLFQLYPVVNSVAHTCVRFEIKILLQY